jgi:hypothetical protein
VAARAHRATDVGGRLNILYASSGSLSAAIADLPTMARSPFQVVVDVSLGDSDVLPFADAAAKAGVNVLWDMRQLDSWSDPGSTVAQLDEHPATYGFYVAEEPQDRSPVQAVCSLLGQRKHPRIGTLFSYDDVSVRARLSPLLGLTEIITCAAYPVGVKLYDPDPSIPLSSVEDIARAMVAAGARHGFAPAMTLQAFSWGEDPTEALTPDFARWPTCSEMKTMRNHAVSGGMQTLFWFGRSMVTHAYDPAGRWADVCAAASGRA